MKIVIFKYNRGWNDVIEEEHEFDDYATEEEINEVYVDWMLEKVSDNFTWYEKE